MNLHALFDDLEIVRRGEQEKNILSSDVPSKGFMSASLAIVAEAPANAKETFKPVKIKKHEKTHNVLTTDYRPHSLLPTL